MIRGTPGRSFNSKLARELRGDDGKLYHTNSSNVPTTVVRSKEIHPPQNAARGHVSASQSAGDAGVDDDRGARVRAPQYGSHRRYRAKHVSKKAVQLQMKLLGGTTDADRGVPFDDDIPF